MARHEDRATIIAYMKATELPPKPRRPESCADYGDFETVGLAVKRRGMTYRSNDPDANQNMDNQFGRYLGKHPDGYAILVVTLVTSEPCAVEVFSTLEGMKLRWSLD